MADDISMGIDIANLDHLDFSSLEYEQAYETWSEWVNGISLSGPTGSELLPASLNRPKPFSASTSEVSGTDSTQVDRGLDPTPISIQSDSLMQEPPQSSVSPATFSNRRQVGSSRSSIPSPSSPRLSLPSLPHQRTPTDSCLCRAGVVLLVPRIRDALAEQKADLVFKVTEDMIRGCQNIMECTVSEVKCTDLICILSVLRHTDGCFELVAQAGFPNGIGTTFGDHEASAFDQARPQQMLVADLVRQAWALLDSIDTSREKMSANFEAYCRPSLAKINLSYIKSVVEDFRNVLNSTT